MDENSRILVTGAQGMLGKAIAAFLTAQGCENVLTPSRKVLDLRDKMDLEHYFAAYEPEYVISCAGEVGGILANMQRPVDFIQNNLQINMNLIELSHNFEVKKFMFIGSSCIYPKFAPQPIREDALLTSPLEKTNEPLAIAKIAIIKLCEAYNQAYGQKFFTCMPTNLYGPNDNYHRTDSHVLPALLRKVHEAKERGDATFTVWGDGTPLREFLYVDDCARAICLLMASDLKNPVVNIGSGAETSIRELAETLKQVVGFQGELVFDTTKPNGTPRKLIDSSLITAIGWMPTTPLDVGVRFAYEDFLKGDVRKGG